MIHDIFTIFFFWGGACPFCPAVSRAYDCPNIWTELLSFAIGGITPSLPEEVRSDQGRSDGVIYRYRPIYPPKIRLSKLFHGVTITSERLLS